jgi:hypothetical protein
MKSAEFPTELCIFCMKDLNQTPESKSGLQFVTALGWRSRTPMGALNGIILGGAGINVLLGSFDGEASQVVLGLGVLGVGLLGRSNFLSKRRSRRCEKGCENDPHSGNNKT